MKRILVVDDDPVFCEVMSELLSKSYNVNVASDGKEALDRIKSENFNLVITDILMPEHDGIEVVKFLKDQNPDSDIIAVSGGGQSMGPDGYLSMIQMFGVEKVFCKSESLADLVRMVHTSLA